MLSDFPDETDRAILFELQREAQLTNTEIADRIEISVSNVGKRITNLENEEIIEKYQPKIDYSQVDHVLSMMLVCTVPVADRESVVQEIADLDPVVRVSELMTGRQNVHLEVVGHTDEITRVAKQIDELGATVESESLVRTTITRSAGVLDVSNPGPPV